MKDVVKSSILSKRWKHLWTQTQNVVYNFTVRGGLEKNMSHSEVRDWKRQHLPHILSFIDRTLLQRVSIMKMFSLSGFQNIECTDRYFVGQRKGFPWMHDLPGIQCLLENAHVLEILIIEVEERKINSPFPMPKTRALFRNQDPHLSFPETRFKHLKNITVDYYINPLNEPTPTGMYNHGVCFDSELLIYILKSVVVLEKLVIVISMIPSCFGMECLSSNCVYQYVDELSSKLLATCLPGTESAKWKLNKTKTRFEFTRSNRASTS